jgi:hypothetical protein
LGFKAQTYSSTEDQEVNITFTSPIKNPNAILYSHLMVLEKGQVRIKINDATFFHEFLDEGEFSRKLEIPTGLIVEGPNTLSFMFPSELIDPNRIALLDSYYRHHEITILGDSRIRLNSTFSNTDPLKNLNSSLEISKTPENFKTTGAGTDNATIESPNSRINVDNNIINNIENNINSFINNSGNTNTIVNLNLVLEIALFTLLSIAVIKYVFKFKK